MLQNMENLNKFIMSRLGIVIIHEQEHEDYYCFQMITFLAIRLNYQNNDFFCKL